MGVQINKIFLKSEHGKHFFTWPYCVDFPLFPTDRHLHLLSSEFQFSYCIIAMLVLEG